MYLAWPNARLKSAFLSAKKLPSMTVASSSAEVETKDGPFIRNFGTPRTASLPASTATSLSRSSANSPSRRTTWPRTFVANTVVTPSAVKPNVFGPMTPAFITSASTDPWTAARPARTDPRSATSMSTISKIRRPVVASSSAFAAVARSRFRHAR
jgi:hypothetical protein